MLAETRALWGVAVLAAGILLGAPARAEEVPDGTVVSAESLDSLLDKTFEGATIQSLISEHFQWQIREKGLTMKLAHSKSHPKDPKWVAATNLNRGKVTLDVATRQVEGWEAGVPFPDIDLNDPQAGLKIMWNVYLGKAQGDSQEYPHTVVALVNEKTGLERLQKQFVKRVFVRGALRRGEGVGEDKRILEKTLTVLTAPQDLKGNGLVLIRYVNGDPDWLLAYAVAARKVRRFSGDFWMDQLGSTDLLTDDLMIIGAHPTWYPEFKVIAKKKMLVIANTSKPFWKKDAHTPQEQLPLFDLANPPHWNPVDTWEPRDVYVVEAKTPERHPYSRKLLYIDAEFFTPYLGEFFTPKGNLWKTAIQGYHVFPTENDPNGVVLWPGWSATFDFLIGHATILMTDDGLRFNTDIDPEQINLNAVKKAKW